MTTNSQTDASSPSSFDCRDWTVDLTGGLLPPAIAVTPCEQIIRYCQFHKHVTDSIATIRNRFSSSHGGGSKIRTVARHVAQYLITITAAAIVLLVTDVDP